MKKIAHRGNLNGPQPERENNPTYIYEALTINYDVEIDVWYDCSRWWLGHDAPTYCVTYEFLKHPGLWIHAKTPETLHELNLRGIGLNYFYHENDHCTLTSNAYIWTCDYTITTKHRAILMLPDVSVNDLFEIVERPDFGGVNFGMAIKEKRYKYEGFWGVCNDWIGESAK